MFNNWKIFTFSIIGIVILCALSYDIISEIGKITQVQKYFREWKSMKDLEVEFKEVKVKKLNTDDMIFDEDLKRSFEIKSGDDDEMFPFYMSMEMDNEKGR